MSAPKVIWQGAASSNMCRIVQLDTGLLYSELLRGKDCFGNEAWTAADSGESAIVVIALKALISQLLAKK